MVKGANKLDVDAKSPPEAAKGPTEIKTPGSASSLHGGITVRRSVEERGPRKRLAAMLGLDRPSDTQLIADAGREIENLRRAITERETSRAKSTDTRPVRLPD